MPRASRFILGCLVESALLVIALVLGRLFGLSPLAELHWRGLDMAIGCLGSFPLFAAFLWMLSSPAEPLVQIRRFMTTNVQPFFDSWSWWQLGAISLVAGLAEECLFRGLIQAALVPSLGPAAAILIAAGLFGTVHLITWTYGVAAAGLGAYLGGLFWLGNNLLIPITTHAVYDFIALVYLLRWMPRHPLERDELE